MNLENEWEKYKNSVEFNRNALPEQVLHQGVHEEYEPNSILVSKGECPDHIYFLEEGLVAGIREYANGSTYSYFQLNSENGSIGLLEILARQKEYIATVSTITKVKVLKIDSAIVYRAIMEDVELLRKCTHLLAGDLYKRSGNDGILYYMSGIDRIRFFLISYYEGHKEKWDKKGELQIPAEYQEIANGIGMSIRTVGRNLQKLKASGEIKDVPKKIIIGRKQYKKLRENIYSE